MQIGLFNSYRVLTSFTDENGEKTRENPVKRSTAHGRWVYSTPIGFYRVLPGFTGFSRHGGVSQPELDNANQSIIIAVLTRTKRDGTKKFVQKWKRLKKQKPNRNKVAGQNVGASKNQIKTKQKGKHQMSRLICISAKDGRVRGEFIF